MNFLSDERELLSLTAHELRSPAAVVAGYLRLLLRENAVDAERARQMIQEADRSCARILNLARELTELAAVSKSDATGKSGVPLFSICADVVQTAAAGHGALTFSCAAEDQAALVQGDAGRLKRALHALVTATLRERGDKALEICGFVSRGDGPPGAVVAFGDPGISLSPAEVISGRETPFDQWRGGTGLSVPIAFRILQGCGGHLWSLPQNSRAACALSLPIWRAEIEAVSEDEPVSPRSDAEIIA